MPLEALRYPVTPTGLHYLLTHFDIPVIEPAGWALSIGGRVGHEISLTLEQIRRRPRVTSAVTFECAGNGRARMDPRPVSQPWLDEAIGTGEWTGTPLSALLRDVDLSEDAVEIVFTGLDHGIDGGVEQAESARTRKRSAAATGRSCSGCTGRGPPVQLHFGRSPGWRLDLAGACLRGACAAAQITNPMNRDLERRSSGGGCNASTGAQAATRRFP
jgi:hypothetical protein